VEDLHERICPCAKSVTDVASEVHGALQKKGSVHREPVYRRLSVGLSTL
jgi:hypothetical protein